jgi:hypothetical protein
MISKGFVAAAAAALVLGGAAQARKPAEAGAPQQVQRLLACRAIADGAQRLSCFDRETAALGNAVAARDVVIIDRKRATEAKRSLFGFSVPNFAGLFGGDNDEIKQVEGVIRSVSYNADGGYVFALQDGSRWSQTEDRGVAMDPRSGDKVLIRRGALGSYFFSVNKHPSVKVKRID